MNSKEQGDNGVGLAINYFIKHGYKVCIPVTSNQRYDLIVDKKGILYRVECKTSKYKTTYDIPRVSLKTCGGNKSGYKTKNISSQECDLVFIAILPENIQYLIPIDIVSSQTTINFGKAYDKYKVS